MKRNKKFRFAQLLEILFVYLLLFAVVLSVGRNVLYGSSSSSVSILGESDFSDGVTPEKAGTLVVWEDDGTGREGRNEMRAILSQMRIPWTEQ